MVRALRVGFVAFALGACSSSSNPVYSRASGSVALSNDGTLVYAVDTDNNEVVVADPVSLQPIGSPVAVGKSPARITVGPDDRVYVSNRGERTVSVLSRSGQVLSEVQRIPVDVEPTGLSLNADGTQLLVVSATGLNDPTQGTLTAIDTSKLTTSWKVTVGEEPRGVAVVGNKAYVTNLKRGTLTTVNLQTHESTGSISLNNHDDPDPTTNPEARTAGAVSEVVPSPDGTHVYTLQAWQLVGPIATPQEVAEIVVQAEDGNGGGGGGGGEYGGGGGGSSGPEPIVGPLTSCNTPEMGSIVTAGLGTVVTSNDQVQTDSFPCSNGAVQPRGMNFPRSGLTLNSDGIAIQGLSAAVVDPMGGWIYVAGELSNNVIMIPTSRSAADPDPSPVTVGAGPNGIALAKDGKSLYVYSQFDHTLSHLVPNGEVDSSGLVELARVPLASDSLPPDAVLGRKMFFSATDPRMTSSTTNLACASCHLEGREDGHVWVFPDGQRQTPSLAGRSLGQTAPYHWAGIFPELKDFYAETITDRMGGSGLADAEADQVTAFLESQATPDNPLQNRPDLAATLAAGRQAFEKATCSSCHANAQMTDNQNHDVGTLSSNDLLEGVDQSSFLANGIFLPLTAVNTPSLLGLGRTAPYLHDGSIPSVSARVAQALVPNANGIRHGDTSLLSDQELSDLETYLLSL